MNAYIVKVAGTEVTDANKDNITGPGITAGTVKYYPSANMLHLTNATIKASGNDYGIYFYAGENENCNLRIDGNCTIEVSGSNDALAFISRAMNQINSGTSSFNLTVKYTGSNNKAAIYTQGNLSFASKGTITATTTGDYAIHDYNKTHSFNAGFYPDITIDATAKTAAIYGFKTMTIPEGSCITYPRAGVWKDSEKTFVSYSTDTTPATHVTIARGYPLWVNGTHVTPDNASDILGDNLVKYSPGSKTLELYGGSFVNNTQGERSIEANQDLTINVWDATVSFEQKPTGYSAVALRGGHKYKFMGLEGNGTINIKAAGQPGIQLFDGSTVEFDHITANITTPSYPISASRGGSVVFNNSDIVLDGKGSTTFLEINNCTFTSCGITNPTGVSFNATKKTFVNSDGTACNSKVTIAPTSYGITVMGKDINTRNYNSLFIGVDYTPSTNTLELHNADFTSDNSVISITSRKATTIELYGTNKLVSNKYNGIYISNTDVTIKKKESSPSTPYLNIESKYVKGSGANTYAPIMNYGNGKLTIEDCTVNTTAQEFGIYTNNSNGTVNINNATINATIKGDFLFHGALEGFKNINLNKATIKSTSPGIYSTDVTPSINLTGANTITSTVKHAIFWEGAEGTSATISSKNNGSLSVSAPKSSCCGIMFKPNLTIKDCNVTVTSNNSCIYGQGKTPSLTVDNANINAKSDYGSTSQGAIEGLSSFTCKNGVAITSPKGAAYNSTIKGITADGTTFCKEVTISAEEYGITVGGTVINAKNCANVFGDGKVKYDPSTNTLTLNNAGIANEGPGINVDNALKNLTINLIGTNSVTSKNSDGMYLGQRTTITSTSNGSLKVNGNIQGIRHYYNFLIKDCIVEASGMNYGITANNYTGNFPLNITNASVKATGNKGAFYGYMIESLTNCYVATPVYNVKFDGTSESVSGFTQYGTMCQTVQILPGTPYDVAVKDVRISSKNANNVLGDGTVTYDNATSTLTMKNANISGKPEYGIYTSKDLNVNLVGNNNIDATAAGINVDGAKKVAISSTTEGTLVIKNANVGIYIFQNGSGVSIKDCALKISDTQWGIAGGASTGGDVEINNSTVSMTNIVHGTLCDVNSIKLTGVKIINPIDAKVGTYGGRKAIVGSADNRIDDVLTIVPYKEYGVTICGEKLSNLNLATYAAKGISFDPETNILTMENANLVNNTADQTAIVFGVGTYTIDLKGENTIQSKYAAIAVALGTLNITSSDGTGKLKCTSDAPSYGTMVAVIGYLNIKDCDVEVISDNATAIDGNTAGGLTIDNANVKAYGKTGSICKWTQFTTSNCYIAAPTGAEIGGTEAETNMGIYKDGAVVMDEYVEIKAGEDPAITAIDAAIAKDPEAKMYNLNGVLVDKNYRGIVIINGKKYMKK